MMRAPVMTDGLPCAQPTTYSQPLILQPSYSHFHVPWQVGGYRIDYAGLSFVTVRNAGHMVPYVQPERAYHMLGDFLFGDPPPAPSHQTDKRDRKV